MSFNQSGAAQLNPNRYRVSRGGAGQNIPAPAALPALTQPPSLPSTVNQAEGVSHSLDNGKAYFRYALIDLLNQELAKGGKPKGEVIKNTLELYNSGLLLPNVYGKLGPMSRGTIYRHRKALNEEGVEGLAPKNGKKGISKITDHEKNCLLTILLRPNRIKKAHAITLTKEILRFKGIESPSSERTLRRFADQFGKEHSDLWILSREGEKAFNDKILPYAERDWELLEVGDGLVADGHRLNFQIIHPIEGKPCRAVLVLFWDWKSSYPLGWEIMIEENIQCIASALRNSILTLGKNPKWVYCDYGKFPIIAIM